MEEALQAIRHRGPDASGRWNAQVASLHVALGHVRLSILDLSEAANQPFSVDGGRTVVVFNGEIYNHKELRDRLRSRGVVFTTHSDTEVLLQAYLQYGRECLALLRGMFAFVIVDTAARRVLAARDGLGIKPLYIIENPAAGEYAFASEVRALEALLRRRFSFDESALAEFLLNGFLYEPSSGLKGVGKVAPGTAVEIDLEAGAALRFGFRSMLAPTDDLESLVTSELALQVEADVPVGVFFSGGVDSTVIAALSPKDLEAILVDYSEDGQHEDRGYAREIAADLGIRYREITHTHREQSSNEILDDFRSVAVGTEEPISDYTYSATKQISRMARAAGYRVMLSGMGGDELLAGYPRHRLAQRWSLLRWLRLGARPISAVLKRQSKWTRRADRLSAFLLAGDFGRAYTSLVGYFSYEEVERLLGDTNSLDAYDQRLRSILGPVAHVSNLKKALYLDRLGYLSHNLTVTDKASMSESLEVRVPLLTEEIAAYGWGLADDVLISGGSGKEPLKRLLRPRLGSRLVDRPKRAFNPPLDGRLRRLGPGVLSDLLLNGSLPDVVDSRFLRKLIDDHFKGSADNTYRLWQLLYLSLWMEKGRAAGN